MLATTHYLLKRKRTETEIPNEEKLVNDHGNNINIVYTFLEKTVAFYKAIFPSRFDWTNEFINERLISEAAENLGNFNSLYSDKQKVGFPAIVLTFGHSGINPEKKSDLLPIISDFLDIAWEEKNSGYYHKDIPEVNLCLRIRSEEKLSDVAKKIQSLPYYQDDRDVAIMAFLKDSLKKLEAKKKQTPATVAAEVHGLGYIPSQPESTVLTGP